MTTPPDRIETIVEAFPPGAKVHLRVEDVRRLLRALDVLGFYAPDVSEVHEALADLPKWARKP